MQFAAQRIALDLHEAGFNAVVAAGSNSSHADLMLRKSSLAGADPSAVLDRYCAHAGESPLAADANPTSLYKAEREFLDQHTLIPLVDLPRAYAIGAARTRSSSER